MKKSNFDINSLKEYLKDKGCNNTAQFSDDIKSLLNVASCGIFNFSEEKELNIAGVKLAVAMASGIEVKELIPISFSIPHFEGIEILKAGDILKLIDMDELLRSVLRKLIGDESGQLTYYQDCVVINIVEIIRDYFWRNIISYKSGPQDFWSYSAPDLCNHYIKILHNLLLYYIHFSCKNMQGQRECIAPLLNFLGECLVLGPKKDDLSTWYILVE